MKVIILHTAFIVLLLTSNASIGSEAEDRADAFVKIFISTCLKHIGKPDELREQLKNDPKFPPEQAIHFVRDGGDAWPVQTMKGNFVIALPAAAPICVVFARKADTQTVLKLFTRIAAHAPAPLISTKVWDEQKATPGSGTVQHLSYEWSWEDVPITMLFTLTIAPSETAGVQAIISAGIGNFKHPPLP